MPVQGKAPSYQDQYNDALDRITSHGLIVERLEITGSIVRCKVKDDKGGKKSGWYVMHEYVSHSGSRLLFGNFGNWKDDTKWEITPSASDPTISAQDHQELMRKRKEAQATIRTETERKHKEAAERAESIFPKLPDSGLSNYLQHRKKVKAYGLGFSRGSIVVPLQKWEGGLVGLQFIDANGGKKFLTGTAKKGAFHLIGTIEEGKPISLVEGYATGASVYEATGWAVLVAFDAGNLKPVAVELRKRRPQAQIIICGDDDHETHGNPGRTKATEVARCVSGLAIFPAFNDASRKSDFNDMQLEQGAKALRAHILDAVKNAAQAQEAAPHRAPAAKKQQAIEWPSPGEIAPGPEEMPYPLTAHPPASQAAIKELHDYLKAPLSMVGTAVLAQMALPAQALADPARDTVLKSPCSLNALIVAPSGERKSAIDGHCSRGAREWAEQEKEIRLPANRKGMAIRQSFPDRKQSVSKRIASLEAKGGVESKTEIKELEQRLEELAEQEADIYVPPIPVIYHEDATPEGLSYAVGAGWPSAMLASDEAGIVIGGRGMSQESAMSLITLFNRLWDGRELNQTRKQAKAAEIKGRRFSVSMMMQPELMDRLVEQGARHLGFLARCLPAAPRSTMGTRFYTPPPRNLSAVDAFNTRAKELLSIDLPVNNRWELEPPVMPLDDEARKLWADYHDEIEKELGEYGDYSLVKDVGAKSAENAARIACVLQIWAEGPGGSITAKWMMSGVTIAYWHLNEALRLFFQADKPQELQDAELLSNWLTTEARERLDEEGRLPIVEILHSGPYRLREKARRDAAIKVLTDPEVAHLRLLTISRRKLLQVNPILLQAKNRNA